MRVLLIAVCVLIALRAILRWLLQTPPKRKRQAAVGPSDGEMVLDSECGVYILKERAVARRFWGSVLYFCSEACAAAHDRP